MQHKKGSIVLAVFMMLSFSAGLLFWFLGHASSYSTISKVVESQESIRLHMRHVQDVVCSLLLPEKKKKEDTTSSFGNSKNLEAPAQFAQLHALYAYASGKEISIFKKVLPQVQAYLSLGVEHGKVNINRMYDFQKHGWQSPEKKKCMEWLCKKIESLLQTSGLFSSLENYLKKRTVPLNDVTQLLDIKEFSQAFAGHVFLDAQASTVALTDIFTVATNHDTLSVVGMSASLALCCGGRPLQHAASDHVQAVLEKLTKDKNKNIEDVAHELYRISWNSGLPDEFKRLLTMNFDLSIFTIMLRCTVHSVEQQTYMIMQLDPKGQKVPAYSIIRMYQI